MDPKGKGMVVNDKEKESVFNEPRDDKPTDSGSSQKKKDGKKKRRIKKIVYYDNDESSSSQRDDDDEKKKTVNSNFSFDYSRIPSNSNAHLLSIPLGKPPHFDGEDYSFWSHKMCNHLFSLHLSILEIVENGMLFDSTCWITIISLITFPCWITIISLITFPCVRLACHYSWRVPITLITFPYCRTLFP
jgi:hypothetical protein